MDHLWEVVWKSFVIFFMLIILARILGKKLLAQLTFFDFVIGITIGTVAGAFVTTTVKGTWVLLSPVFLTILTVGMGFLTVKNLFARKVLEGEPVIIIQNGKILEKNMLKLRYHLDDLEMQLREKSIFDIGQVEFAIFEPHGKLSVLKKSQYQPLTPKDLKMSTQYMGLATEIIKDGDVLEQNLKQNNLTMDWLRQELKKQRIDKISDVVYAALNTDGTLCIDKRNDDLQYVQKVEDKPEPKA